MHVPGTFLLGGAWRRCRREAQSGRCCRLPTQNPPWMKKTPPRALRRRSAWWRRALALRWPGKPRSGRGANSRGCPIVISCFEPSRVRGWQTGPATRRQRHHKHKQQQHQRKRRWWISRGRRTPARIRRPRTGSLRSRIPAALIAGGGSFARNGSFCVPSTTAPRPFVRRCSCCAVLARSRACWRRPARERTRPAARMISARIS